MKMKLPLALIALLSVALAGCGSNKSKSSANDTANSDSVEVSTDGTSASDAVDAPADKSVMVNGHMFVDLGLPSGLLWASVNIGAEVATEDGVRFAWGETNMTEKEDFFDQVYYKYYNSDNPEGEFTKYNSTDKKTTLDKEDDAAYVNWGAPCRMPTHAEVEELSNPEYCTWTLSDGGGYIVTSKKNGNSIFLFACGTPFDGILDGYCVQGNFWTSSKFVDEDGYAQTLSFDREERKNDVRPCRYNGLPVRPVVNPKELSQAKTQKAAPCFKIINGHKFLDLALPSKLLWAETNMGAASPTDVGTYFAWGETQMKQKESFDWKSYKFGTTAEKMTKYNSKDAKYTLDSEDDAATVNWGPSCRMPDTDDFRELLSWENCTFSWVDMTNSTGASVKVCKVTSLRNGKSIFLPAAGSYTGKDENRDRQSDLAKFWTRSCDNYVVELAFFYWKGGGDNSASDRADRCEGFPIRPVAEQ